MFSVHKLPLIREINGFNYATSNEDDKIDIIIQYTLINSSNKANNTTPS